MIGVLIGIEVARRVVGQIFVFIGVLMLLYGVFGIMANVLATYVILFMLAGYSPAYSAIIGLASCVAISHKTKETRIDLTIVWIILVTPYAGLTL